jgi:hypothetical protein
MTLLTRVTVSGSAGWSDPGLSFVDRSADELAAAIDALAGLPDLSIERDGMLGDKGWITVRRDRSSLILYFPPGTAARYEYADPSGGEPATGPAVSLSGDIPFDVSKEVVRLMARGIRPDDFLRAHTIEDNPTEDPEH